MITLRQSLKAPRFRQRCNKYVANTLRKHVDSEIRCPPFIESLSLDYVSIIFIRSHLCCRFFSAANGSLASDVAIYVGIVVVECLRVYE